MSAQPFLLRMYTSAHLLLQVDMTFLGAYHVKQTLENDALHKESVILLE